MVSAALVQSFPGPALTVRREQATAACTKHSTLPLQQRGGPRRRRAAAAPRVAALPAAATLADVALATGDLQPWVLPAVGAGVALAGLAALRLSAYSQLEYVTAAMLARHVRPGGARVLQLGGSTRDLFYYPAGTVQVTVGGPDIQAGLWEQAGMQAKVPVVAVKQEAQRVLSTQAGSVADAIVLVNQLGQWADPQQLLSQVYRVLKPGGTFIFIQRLAGGSPLQPLLGGTAGAVDAAVVEAVQGYSGWDFVQWDTALEGTDPHAVGVAVKPLAAAAGSSAAAGSVDKVAFEQIMRRNSRGRKQQQTQQQ
ncbi:hypothetical protein ABPG75_014074 [Micractinium tetrahymenae]